MRLLSRKGALAFLPLALAAGCSRAPLERPNIVILVSDDQDYEHFGFMGHPLAHTPTLDALASDGVVFTRCLVPMSRCRPAQASLLSGQWPHQNGVYFNVGADHIDPDTCIANLLTEVGFQTTGEGKFWEVNPRLMGFSNYTIRNYETFVREGQEHLFDFIDEHAGEEPMFIWWAPSLPHVPHNPTPELLALFDRTQIPIPDWYTGDEAEYRRREHTSLAMEAWLDRGVAELLAKLEAVGEYENTVFLFLVDNGYANGLASKGTAFEKGLRTPVVITWPGKIEGGRRYDELVSVVDLYQTLVDYGAAARPEDTVGVSLRPLLDGQAEVQELGLPDALFGAIYLQSPLQLEALPERDAFGLWARTERFKYVLYLRDVREAQDERFKIQALLTDYPERNEGDEDLFDLVADPYELENLAHLPEHAELKRELRRRAYDWWRETGGAELVLP